MKGFQIFPFGENPGCITDGWLVDSEEPKTNLKMTTLEAVGVTHDAEFGSEVLEIKASEFFRGSIVFPDTPEKFIGTPFPYLMVHLRNLKKFTAIEVDIEDTEEEVRKFRASNSQSLCRLIENVCCIPMTLTEDWNVVVLDLRSLCARVFGTEYKHCVRVRIFANCRLGKVFFAENAQKEP